MSTNVAFEDKSRVPQLALPHPKMSTPHQSDDSKVDFEHVDEHYTPPPPAVKTTLKMVFFAVYVGLAAFSYGFDAGYAGTVLQMVPFNDAFGKCVTSPTGKTVCLLDATRQSVGTVYQLASTVGAVLAALMSKWIGRRTCLQIGCVWVAIGSAGMLGTSGNYTAYVACHCIEGVGLGHFFSMAPIYGVECVAPAKRGMLMSLYNVGSSLGIVVIAAVCVGSAKISSNWAWQIPIICQIPLSLLYAAGLMMFSESPRWLIIQGKEEAARKSFASYYNMDPSSTTITAQIDQVRAAIQYEKSISSTTSWTEIFRGTDLRRTTIACVIIISVAFSGLWLIVPYASLFLGGLGINDPFTINLIVSVTLFSGTTVSPFILEYLGRRLSMLVGYSCMAVCMLIFAAVSSALGASNSTAQTILVAFICLWSVAFGMMIGNVQWVASSEMHSVRLRTYGQVFAASIGSITTFAASFWTPYMINADYGNMGTNVGYFYFGLTVVFIVILYFILPETGRLSLEAIDDIFTSHRPAWKTSLKRNKLIAKGE